jgi:hypothetical protein
MAQKPIKLPAWGWGHSALEHALAFDRIADVRHLVAFHHDPGHSDDEIDRMMQKRWCSPSHRSR